MYILQILFRDGVYIIFLNQRGFMEKITTIYRCNNLELHIGKNFCDENAYYRIVKKMFPCGICKLECICLNLFPKHIEYI